MKIRNLLFGMAVSAAALTSCVDNAENLGTPELKLSASEMSFDLAGGDQNVSVTASRDWTAEADVDWIVVNPESGEASPNATEVTVTVLPNTGLDREADVTFSIGMVTKTLTVSQSGEKGSADQLIVYYNDFDKEEATKTYGTSGGSWPYLDQFEGWKNQTGTGAAGVTYSFSGMSARANSTSDSSYSDYEGSGANNMFFGNKAYFAVKNIALNGNTDLAVSFGTEKYSQDNGSVFTPSEFHVYLSNDGNKWVELTEYTFAGGTTEGRWNVASAIVSVPSATANLSISMAVDVASSYRMDDLKIAVAEAAGTSVDFSKAVEMDFTAGSTGGGSATTPSDITDVTVAQFNEKAVSTTEWYRLTGTVGGPINTTYGNFDLIDETGTVYVYGISNWSEYSATFVEGGTVTVVGQRGDYQGKIEVVEGYIESYTADGGNNDDNGSTTPTEPTALAEVTIAEFITKTVNTTDWYKLTGTITEIQKETYGNFVIEDETGSILIYGMTSKWVGSNDQSFSQLGLNVGDIVTLGTLRSDYNGTPQGGGSSIPAYYISHVDGEAPEVTPTGGKYVKVSAAQDDWSGKYLVVFDGAAHASLSNKDLNATVSDLVISNDEIVADSAIDAAALTVAKNGEAYSVLLPSGKYFGMQKNGCLNCSEPFDINFEYTEEGIKISGYVTSESNTFFLYWNSNNGNYYRCYVDKNGMDGYTLPTLYKYISE